jgi:hypothetical protein
LNLAKRIMYKTSPYRQLIQKTIFEYMDKFPDCPNLTLARIIHKSDPILFKSVENTRTIIRGYRGANGKRRRSYLSTKKYLK